MQSTKPHPILLLLLLLALASPALAQDPTADADPAREPTQQQEPTLAAPLETVGGADITVNIEQDPPPLAPAPEPYNPWNLALPLVSLLTFALGAISAGIPYHLALKNASKQQKDTAEQLYNAMPPTTHPVIQQLIKWGDMLADNLKATTDILKQVTDGLPNVGPGETPPAWTPPDTIHVPPPPSSRHPEPPQTAPPGPELPKG